MAGTIPHVMRRSLPLLLLLVLAAACGPAVGNPGVAAVVEGREIPMSLVQARFEEVRGAPVWNDLVAQQDAQAAEELVVGTILGQLITAELFTDAAEERDIPLPTEEEVEAQLEEIIAQQFGSQEAFEEQIIVGQGASMESVLEQVRLGMLIEAFAADVTAGGEVSEEAVQALYDQQYGTPSVAHILVATEEEAQDVIERIEGGEDFAAVAADVSTDPGSGPAGGELGPLQIGAFVPEFEEAALALEPGELSEPVQTQFGFHIIRTTAPPTLEEVREEVEAAAAQQAGQLELEALQNELRFNADITVNPRFGSWDGLQQTVDFADPLGDLESIGGAATDGLGDGLGLDPALPADPAAPAAADPAAPAEPAGSGG